MEKYITIIRKGNVNEGLIKMKKKKCFNQIIVSNHRKKAMIGKAFPFFLNSNFNKTLDL